MDTHTVRWTVASIELCPLPSQPRHPPSSWALFPTRSTLYLYCPAINRPLATAQLPLLSSLCVHIVYFCMCSHKKTLLCLSLAFAGCSFCDARAMHFVLARQETTVSQKQVIDSSKLWLAALPKITGWWRCDTSALPLTSPGGKKKLQSLPR